MNYLDAKYNTNAIVIVQSAPYTHKTCENISLSKQNDCKILKRRQYFFAK